MVTFPTQRVAVPVFDGLAQTLKLCGTLPALRMWKLTVPTGACRVESLNENSVGAPAVTTTTTVALPDPVRFVFARLAAGAPCVTKAAVRTPTVPHSPAIVSQ